MIAEIKISELLSIVGGNKCICLTAYNKTVFGTRKFLEVFESNIGNNKEKIDVLGSMGVSNIAELQMTTKYECELECCNGGRALGDFDWIFIYGDSKIYGNCLSGTQYNLISV